ncbi:anhydro-N-acetylmuramic acid kinase [Dokdonella sp.]|uniref:anhydro-N-acetylmuramic acid kinase n=1 Tax=Dokdonella sp. TaxID=2291710 RepID=UPI001B102706|nr:anhydro-N-acetylmuramic acid kinase [Dokdonella sp.]MBO9661278.1 anhydro-N-acetylmuramic acid kinase [Dokdonella sp.]
MAPVSWLYLGLISGTSADGIDAALVEFATPPAAEPFTAGHSGKSNSLRIVAARTTPYPEELRRRVLALATSTATIALDDYGRLDVEIGECFAAAANALLHEAGVPASAVVAIGSHGQTVRHRVDGAHPFTLQIGDPSVIAERTGLTTVADFRRADVAAGGQGAPLLPSLHAAVFADPRVPRAILNLGGIANLTLLDSGRPVIGFDSGPANCLLDAWAERHLGAPRDEGGAWARSGRVDEALLAELLADPFFAAAPPKSTGREDFNLAWLEPRLGPDLAPADVQATLLALSARSIADALLAHAPATREIYACGGGVHNPALMDALRARLPRLRIDSTAVLGLDPDYVEAVGFAWLARERLDGDPGNLPSVTGARGPRRLGAIYPAGGADAFSRPMSR